MCKRPGADGPRRRRVPCLARPACRCMTLPAMPGRRARSPAKATRRVSRRQLSLPPAGTTGESVRVAPQRKHDPGGLRVVVKHRLHGAAHRRCVGDRLACVGDRPTCAMPGAGNPLAPQALLGRLVGGRRRSVASSRPSWRILVDFTSWQDDFTRVAVLRVLHEGIWCPFFGAARSTAFRAVTVVGAVPQMSKFRRQQSAGADVVLQRVTPRDRASASTTASG